MKGRAARIVASALVVGCLASPMLGCSGSDAADDAASDEGAGSTGYLPTEIPAAQDRVQDQVDQANEAIQDRSQDPLDMGSE